MKWEAYHVKMYIHVTKKKASNFYVYGPLLQMHRIRNVIFYNVYTRLRKIQNMFTYVKC